MGKRSRERQRAAAAGAEEAAKADGQEEERPAREGRGKLTRKRAKTGGGNAEADSDAGSSSASGEPSGDEASSEDEVEGESKSAAAAKTARNPKALKAAEGAEEADSDGDDEDDYDDNGSEGDLEAFTVYIEGIPWDASSEDLWTLFSGAGTLLDLRLPRWNDSGRLRGYGHADFGSEKEMRQCIKKLDSHEMGKRYLRVTEAKRKSSATLRPGADARPAGEVPENCKSLFVKNLPYDADESMVEEAFTSFGKVENVRLPRWNHTGRYKGFGYVEFASSAAVKTVLGLETPLHVGDRIVAVDADVEGGGRPKGSFRDASGRQWLKTDGRKLRQQRQQQFRGRGRGRGQGRGRGRGRGRGPTLNF